jgi:hypothetical protein
MTMETVAPAASLTLPGETEAALQRFLALASTEQTRVDKLLACPDPRFGVLPRRCREHVERAGTTWSVDAIDPEFRKNLRIFQRLIAGAVGVCARARCSTASDASASGSAAVAGAHRVVCRIDELGERIELPRDVPLTLKVLLGRRFALEQLLVEIGDAPHLRTRAAELYTEGEGTSITWKALYAEKPPPLFDAKEEPDAIIKETRHMLAQLLAAKEAHDMPIRARLELKERALWLVFASSLAAFVAFAYAMRAGDIGPVGLPVAAGLTGAALGMLIKLRDEVNRGVQVRAFLPFIPAQLVIGATAGLLVSLAAKLSDIQLASANAVGAVSFVTGFSEAAFLRLVGKIAELIPETAPSPRGGGEATS